MAIHAHMRRDSTFVIYKLKYSNHMMHLRWTLFHQERQEPDPWAPTPHDPLLHTYHLSCSPMLLAANMLCKRPSFDTRGSINSPREGHIAPSESESDALVHPASATGPLPSLGPLIPQKKQNEKNKIKFLSPLPHPTKCDVMKR